MSTSTKSYIMMLVEITDTGNWEKITYNDD
jgi:hypothetical protein